MCIYKLGRQEKRGLQISTRLDYEHSSHTSAATIKQIQGVWVVILSLENELMCIGDDLQLYHTNYSKIEK